MKKIIASAVGLMLVGGVAATSALAVESQFGGIWRTNYYFRDNFVQPDSAFNAGENRTRLYYTAKFSDNFKFVNKFEFDTSWGDAVGGDIGADGNVFELKNSYADFTLGMVNVKLGIQGAVISRGFIFDNDFSGAVVTGDFGMVKVPVLYAAGPQEDVNKAAYTFSSKTGLIAKTGGAIGDTHVLSTMPSFNINDAVKVTPHATWLNVTSSDEEYYWLGVDVDLKFDAVSAWMTGIYEGGDTGAATNNDKSAWLFGAGANAGIVHGEAFYASGDDDGTGEQEFTAPSPSHYWSEIMGLGTFDLNGAVADGTPGDYISNVWAANIGVTVKPVDKLTFDFDVWYAQLAEEVNVGTTATPDMQDELGLEFDGKLTYQIMDNLTGKLVFAYLVAGDAVGEDVMEGGVQISLSF